MKRYVEYLDLSLFPMIPIDHIIPDVLENYRCSFQPINVLFTQVSTSSTKTEFYFIPSGVIFVLYRKQKKCSGNWQDLIDPEKHLVFENINLPEMLPKLPNVHKIQLWQKFKTLALLLMMQKIGSKI